MLCVVCCVYVCAREKTEDASTHSTHPNPPPTPPHAHRALTPGAQTVISQIREVRASSQMHVLQSIPELKDLTARLAAYERRLEAYLRPKFVAALRSNDVKTAVELAAVYKDIGQEAAMRITYFDARLEDLQTFWSSYQPPLTGWLPLFYARLQNVVVAETEWCKLLFGRSQKEGDGESSGLCCSQSLTVPFFLYFLPSELTAHLLAHFDSSLASRLGACTLPEVVELHQGALSDTPFQQHIQQYGALEKDHLFGRNTALASSARGVPTTTASQRTALSASAAQLTDPFIAGDEAVERCQSLTNFTQYVGLIDALEVRACFMF
jgi:hypothetical protein